MEKALFKLSNEQDRVMEAIGNLLILGGPGSGKTTVAILKAKKLVTEELRAPQKVIFLSFSRSAVARITEALDQAKEINKKERQFIEIETYHAFFWRLIKSHGYLLGLPRALELLTPAAEAVALASVRKNYARDSTLTDTQKIEKSVCELAERNRLAWEEGKVSFDLFADLAGEILHGSMKIRKLIGEAYPFVILDEFQDTNNGQWNVVQALGQESELIALADPEQRIFEFIGANPERLNHYREAFKPLEFDLADDNHRSGGTHIACFGNDVLTGEFRSNSYDGVTVLPFAANQNQAYAALKGQVFQARRRLIERGTKDWSLAVLVPTKKMTRTVSDVLESNVAGRPSIQHHAFFDVEEALLAAEVIAFLLQLKAAIGDFDVFVRLVCNFYEGRGGEAPSKTHLAESDRIWAEFNNVKQAHAEGKRIRKNSLILPMLETYNSARAIELTGDPDADWRSVRALLEGGSCKRLNEIAWEVRNLRLLHRGTQLRTALSENWRASLSYGNALDVVRRAFVHEHFASVSRPETGVCVMNMHKAKGKQFDEVIIFEGWPLQRNHRFVSNPDRIVRSNSRDQDLSQARQNFRVSITRAKGRITILTPKSDPCILLSGFCRIEGVSPAFAR
ncbi:MAG: UvrD-helicase domain-containing protein [Armatimonadota bacterium]